MAHVQRKCSACRRSVPAGARACPACGSREASWVARYRGPDHRERSRSFERKIDAERHLADQESRKVRGEWTDPRAGLRRYSEWVEELRRSTSNLRPSTRARDESYLRSLILPTFGDAPLSSVGQPCVRTWVADLEARGLAPATVGKAYQILGKTLRAAVDAGLIPRSPARAIPLPRQDRGEIHFLTPEDVARLADSIHPRYRALVLVGAFGGLRIGELAGLRRSRVDLLRRRIQVAETLVEVRGQLLFGPPKTKAGRRSLTLPRAVAQELVAHLEAWGGPDLVFTAPEGGPLRVGQWRQRFWKKAVEKAGLDGFTPHGLRHTAVALWIAAGANPKEVAVRAGHTSVARVLDLYGHLYEEADERLADRLDAAYRAADAGPLRDESGTAVVQLARLPVQSGA
jgi:integrase